MCEKVDQLFNQMLREKELDNLFSYVEQGGMKVSFAAKQADLSPKAFREQM